MTAIAIGSIFAVTLVAVVYVVKKLPGGCWGDCYQGRRSCNCKGEKNGK